MVPRAYKLTGDYCGGIVLLIRKARDRHFEFEPQPDITPKAISWELDMVANVNNTISTSANTLVLPMSKYLIVIS